MPAIMTRRAALSVLFAVAIFATSFGVGRAGQSEPEPSAPRVAEPPAIEGLSTPRAVPPLARAPRRKRKAAPKRAPASVSKPAPRPEPAVSPEPAPVPAPAPLPAPAPRPAPKPSPAPGPGFDDSG